MSEAPVDLSAKDVIDALKAAQAKLDREDAKPLSPQAYGAFKNRINDYVVDLFVASLGSARRRREDLVSASDVNHASDFLAVGVRSRWLRFSGLLGGVFLGAGLSTGAGMVLADHYTGGAVAGSVLFSAIGGGLVVAELLRDS